MAPTFAETYCARHRLAAGDFERALLRRILYPHARLLAPFLRAAQPGFFQDDLELIRSVGQIRHLRQFHEACNDYRQHLEHTSAARRLLRFRASSRKLFHLAADTLPATGRPRPTDTSSPHPAATS